MSFSSSVMRGAESPCVGLCQGALEWLGKGLSTVGIIIRDSRVVQFSHLLEDWEARSQGGHRSVGKQVVGQGDRVSESPAS